MHKKIIDIVSSKNLQPTNLVDFHNHGQYDIQEIHSFIEKNGYIKLTEQTNFTLPQILCNKVDKTSLHLVDNYSHRIANLLGQVFGILVNPEKTPLAPAQLTQEVREILAKRAAFLKIQLSNNTVEENEPKQTIIDFPFRMLEIDGISFFNFAAPITPKRELIYLHPLAKALAVYNQPDIKNALAEIIIVNTTNFTQTGRLALPKNFPNVLAKQNYILKDIALENYTHANLYERSGYDLFDGLFIRLEPHQEHHFLVMKKITF